MEAGDTTVAQADMADFFDFGQASMNEDQSGMVTAAECTTVDTACSSQIDAQSCFCHDSIDCIGFANRPQASPALPAALEGSAENLQSSTIPIAGQTTEFSTDFSSYIPRYSKPAEPCDYCRSRQFECFVVEGQSAGCSPCIALFRSCSFADAEPKPKQKGMNTLHLVPEDACQERGALTWIASLRSTVAAHDDKDTSKKNGGLRFSRAIVKILKGWLEEHAAHPYPSEEEKEVLKNKTGLRGTQISNWLANARRRGKFRSSGTSSPATQVPEGAVDIPQTSAMSWDAMNPLERWKHSPPENEPASVSAIANAMASTEYRHRDSVNSEEDILRNQDSSNGSSFSLLKAPSSTSFGTAISSGSIGSVESLALSHGSHNSLNSLGNLTRKDSRRRRRQMPRAPRHDQTLEQRPFKCTFCTDNFKTKHDWTRHEKSLHISLEKWICAPLGPVTISTLTGSKQCVYCGHMEPTKNHIEAHNHNDCDEKGLSARTFYRKDHLRQHLRLVHGCRMIESMNSWKITVDFIRSRCGFCSTWFDRWQDRVEHLAKDFRAGSSMKSWKGCRGFDSSVQSQITNAMPPYLIGDEARTPFPFSASIGASMYQHIVTEPDVIKTPLDIGEKGQNNFTSIDDRTQGDGEVHASTSSSQIINQPHVSRKTTCWEVLTLRLGDFVREQVALGTVMSDDILQQEARMLLYGDYDPWNQTAADNPEWLALFKKAHGIATQSFGGASRKNSGNNGGDISSKSPFDFSNLDQEDLMDLGLSELSFDRQF